MPRDSWSASSLDSSMNLMRLQNEQISRERDAVFHERNPVIKAFEALQRYVADFEATLNEEQEVGARLVSFGQSVTFHVQSIGFSKPNIVTFVGTSDGGQRVQLIQHVSQLSFLLVAMQKIGPKPNRIGFVWAKDA